MKISNLKLPEHNCLHILAIENQPKKMGKCRMQDSTIISEL